MIYRRLTPSGPWPPWVRQLQGRSGVYVVRSRSGAYWYVGESHTGNLYGTLTRHFQHWSGETRGAPFDRDEVQVGVVVLAASKAKDAQNRLIQRHHPRDNEQGQEGQSGGSWWTR